MYGFREALIHCRRTKAVWALHKMSYLITEFEWMDILNAIEAIIFTRVQQSTSQAAWKLKLMENAEACVFVCAIFLSVVKNVERNKYLMGQLFEC